MITDMTQQKIKAAYSEEINCLKEFMQLLNEERTALKERNAERIMSCCEQKKSLVTKLDGLDQTRKTLLENTRPTLNTESPDFEEFIHGQDEILQGFIRDFQHQNRINGSILETSRLFTQELISIITGSQRNQNIYNASGSKQQSLPSQQIAKV